jgi:hypothetical protein
LSEEDTNAIVLPEAVVGHLALAVAHEDVCAGAHGKLDEAEVLAACGLVEEGHAGVIIEVGEVEEAAAGGLEEGDEGLGGRWGRGEDVRAEEGAEGSVEEGVRVWGVGQWG